MMKYAVGLQLYSVRGDLARDFEGTLRAVSETGYNCVEFSDFCGKAPEEVKELCRKYGLDPVSAGVPLSDMCADPDKFFSACKIIGCRYAAVSYLAPGERPNTPGYGETVPKLAFLTKKAREYRLPLMYHNHYFEFVRLENGKCAYDDLFDRVPGLCAQIDTCWMNYAGEDPVKYLKKYADRIPVVHFKDFVMPGKRAEDRCGLGMEERDKAEPEGFSYRPLGYGAQDLRELIASLEGSVCETIVVEQDEPSMGKSRLECARMSRETLRKLGF